MNDYIYCLPSVLLTSVWSLFCLWSGLQQWDGQTLCPNIWRPTRRSDCALRPRTRRTDASGPGKGLWDGQTLCPNTWRPTRRSDCALRHRTQRTDASGPGKRLWEGQTLCPNIWRPTRRSGCALRPRTRRTDASGPGKDSETVRPCVQIPGGLHAEASTHWDPGPGERMLLVQVRQWDGQTLCPNTWRRTRRSACALRPRTRRTDASGPGKGQCTKSQCWGSMFWGLPDHDPLVIGTDQDPDPDPSLFT